jgi:hypothetical protein
MVFKDTSTKLGLIEDCEQLVFGNYGDISGSTERMYDFTARINRAYDKLATLLMSVDGRWQFDDTNYTDLPIGKTALTSGQQDYAFDIEHLDVEKVLALDEAGNKYILKPFDIHDPIATPFLTEVSTAGGIPQYYDKKGPSMFLYPTPNYTKANGLIVHYRRKPVYFVYTDTTEAVGVPAIFHRYLSLEASLDYAVSKMLPVKNDLNTRVKEMEESIKEWYSKRSRDESLFIRPAYRTSR